MKILEIKPLRKKIIAQVKIPASKSYTNRALFIAALTEGKTRIINPLISEDTKAMISCLKEIGVKILEKENLIEVSSRVNLKADEIYDLDVNFSGTTMRFLLSLCAVTPGTKILYGKEGLNKRPVADLVDGLTQLGAQIVYLDKKGYPPIKILPSEIKQKTVEIKGSLSSQYISSLLMIGPILGGLKIEVSGKQISKPYIDMTIDIMKKFGVEVSNKQYRKYDIASGQRYIPKIYHVEGDLSSACYFLALAALTKSTITVKNINTKSKQADIKFVNILKKMGNKITFGKEKITVNGKGVRSLNVDMEDCPDQVQTLAVLAAFAKGVTRISGISSLRIKETDRVSALRAQLKKMAIKTTATKNVLTIEGGNPQAAEIATYGDHRMVMSFALTGAKIPGMLISDPDCVNKTFPEFWKKLNSAGVKTKITESKNIVLIGMRGSGKSTVAKKLAKKLNKLYLDLDEILTEQMKMSVSQIVETFGWEFFRDKESEIVKQAAKNQGGLIISTGGGVVTRPENIEALRKNGILIYLNTPLEILIKRVGTEIGKNPKMPALTDKKDPKIEIAQVLSQREKLYRQAAHKMLLIGSLKTAEIADKIIATVKEIS